MKTNELKDKFLLQSLDGIMSNRYGVYAKYIIQQRALPDVRDGLKPVQRRILYSMHELGLTSEKPFKKSARVVGDVIGKYHPHGDSSIYEAMVRMSQEWKMNVPLIQMHGNIGSIDDDPAAAMRYTEARLSKISSLLLSDIKSDTVSFSLNFDDSEKEPTVLPAFFPNLLVNGARGIAAGFATEIPPHNLGEVIDGIIAKIKNPNIKIETLNTIIKGPDFPTGGIIYGIDGIKEAAFSGRGRITITSKYEVHKNQIVITEIPYGVVKSKLVRQIDEINLDKNIGGMNEVRDETNRDGIKIVIDLEAGADASKIMKFLMQKTELQLYYSYNNIAIHNNAPVLMNLHDLIQAFLDHVKVIQTNKINFELEKLSKRLEIIEGFIKLTEISDQVIEMIRKSEGSKVGVVENLIKIFNFSEIQAESIANLRLYRLSKTDVEEFIKEKQELETRINFLKTLLSSESEFNAELIKIFKDIKKTYATPRKTEIKDQALKLDVSLSDLIQAEETFVGISRDGYIKRFNQKIHDSNEMQTYLLKEDDALIFLSKTLTTGKLLIFTNQGNYISIPIFKIAEEKWKNLGIHLNDFATLLPNEFLIKVLYVDDFSKDFSITLITKKGFGKKVQLPEFEVSRENKSYPAIKFKKDGDELLNAFITNDRLDILLVNTKLEVYKFSENDFKTYGIKAAGVKISDNATKFEISAAIAYSQNDTLVFLTESGHARKINPKKVDILNQKSIKTFLSTSAKPSGKIIKYIFNLNDNVDLAIRTTDSIVTINTKEISETESFTNLHTKGIYGAISLGDNSKLISNKLKHPIENLIPEQKVKLEKDKQNLKFEDDQIVDNALSKINKIPLFDVDSIIKKKK
ncbi:DNA topoisomerase IV subunit A [[Mycoplasma] mobile]|uniref:DNA topoisomerase (ATP-hydrolyzing) n=1 Tax=Mycoplasma mobile (strain ATCC 43663 / 163K / NCTC 11711) TaxID=267748 RepID=Q6KHI4_MYCM1|nr:DNA topoisomerase IV subunit A [[Mycoplasma] mobile]AAT27946.1 topoisomerase IV subunit A [Mycoplasma mobile 163K]